MMVGIKSTRHIRATYGVPIVGDFAWGECSGKDSDLRSRQFTARGGGRSVGRGRAGAVARRGFGGAAATPAQDGIGRRPGGPSSDRDVVNGRADTPELPAIRCARCGESVEPVRYVAEANGGAPTASSFDSCLRVCRNCNLAYSNARDPERVVLIHGDPLENVPAQVRSGLAEALASSLNIRNRPNKRVKFGFETSEDAVTWTVFRYLHESGLIGQVLEACLPAAAGIAASLAKSQPPTLLWGSPVPAGDERAGAIRTRLESLLSSLGENPESYSEPDVLIDFGAAGLVIIEVKYRSPNDNKDPDYGGWSRYMDQSGAFTDEGRTRKSGEYELARNWRFGWSLAEDRPLWLVNLGPSGLFTEPEGARLAAFEAALSQTSSRRFVRLTWPEFLGAIHTPPDWLTAFTEDRELRMAVPKSRRQIEAASVTMGGRG
jgi:hypothetical protein